MAFPDDPVYVQACANYVSLQEDGSSLPQRIVGFRLQDDDADPENGEVTTVTLASGVTNFFGCTYVPVERYEKAGERRDLYANFTLCNPRVCETKPGEAEGYYSLKTPTFQLPEEGDFASLGSVCFCDTPERTGAGRVFQVINNAFMFSLNGAVGLDFGLGEVPAVAVHYPCDCAGLSYAAATATIFVPAGDEKKDDGLAHEYGHHVLAAIYQDHAPGGVDYHGITPDMSHKECQGYHGGAAMSWSEGWADFYGVRAN
jgi:hypothetical protein